MIELLELSEVPEKAVERTGTEVRYYDQSCENKQQQGFTDSIPTWIYSLFAHAITLITVTYLTLCGMKLYTWYKLATQVNQCSAVITMPRTQTLTSNNTQKQYPVIYLITMSLKHSWLLNID